MLASLPESPIQPYQRTGETRAQMAERLGVSVGHLRRLLAQERSAQPSKGRDDLPLVQITAGRVEGWHYNLSHDQASELPSGPFRIGTARGGVKVAHAADDKSRTRPPAKSKAKFRPRGRKGKKHKPAPLGVAG